MGKVVLVIVSVIVNGVAAHAAVVLPAADGHLLDAGFAGRFVVTGSGPGLVLRWLKFDDSVEGIDGAPDVSEVKCDMQILSWDDVNRELFYWKSDQGGYSIWVWRPDGAPALVAWSYTQPATTMEGLGGGRRPLNDLSVPGG